jgi:predicted nucleotidyltransferase
LKDYRRIAEAFARRVKAKYGDRIERVVLFGSVARGDYREDSDVDLLVVTPGDWLDLQSDLAGDAVDILLRDGVVVSPLVISAEEAARLPGTALGRELAREGLAVA